MSTGCDQGRPDTVAVHNKIILQVLDLCIEFYTAAGVVRAVNNISFSLPAGQVLALAGESGSGKTVTALSILNLVAEPGRITAGKILLGNQNLCDLPEAALEKIRGKQIGMIFQNPLSALNPALKIGSQFLEAIQTHQQTSPREARQFSTGWLQLLGLQEPERIMASYPWQLSIGMCQRVVSAMALALQPQVLIADEPTSALDVGLQVKLIEEIDRLRRSSRSTVLFITHDLYLAQQIADSLAIMYAGSIIEYGKLRQLVNQPRHPYTQGLLQARILPGKPEIAFIPGMPPSLRDLPANQCAFEPRCRYSKRICREQKPVLLPADTGQTVACHLIRRQEGL